MRDRWPVCVLKDVVTLQRGHDLPQRLRRPGVVPVISSGGQSGWHDELISDGPGVVLGRATNLGKPYWVEGPYWPLNTTLYVRDFKGNDPRFIYHLFETLDLTGFNSGSVQPMLNRNYIANVPIRVPPLEEQQRIASVLSTFDDLIKNLETTCDKLNHLQLALFRARWDGFARVPLSALGAITMGQSPPGETYNEEGNGLPFYQGVKDFESRHPGRRVYCTAPSRLAYEGDVLIAVRAPIGDTNVAVEKCAIGRGLAALASDRPSTALQALRCDPELWSRFQSDGTVFAAVNKQTLAANLVPWVNDQEFEVALAPMDALYKVCWTEAKQLRTHRDELLPLLVSGRVKVEEIAA